MRRQRSLRHYPEAAVTPDLIDAARELDRHYIPARYPNAHPQGAPYEFYARADAERAVQSRSSGTVRLFFNSRFSKLLNGVSNFR